MNIKYVVTLDYHDYTFNNACDAMTFAKLAMSGGRTRVDVTMYLDEDDKESEEDEEE